MRRFEFDDGKSRKFWEIAVDASTYTVRFGRLGTDGQTSTKVAASPERAVVEVDKLIASKVKKGYVEVEAAAPAADPSAEFDAAILADPDDSSAWQVLADWLQSQGDPRGELVAVQLALSAHPAHVLEAPAAPPRRVRAVPRGSNAPEQPVDDGPPADLRELLAREADLLARHARALLGDFAPDKPYAEVGRFTWRHGYWRSARVWTDWDHDAEEASVPKMLGSILRHPSARFLDRLEIGLTDTEGEASWQACLDTIVKHGVRPSLRELHVGAFEFPDDTEISWTEIGTLDKVWAVVPNLTWLKLTGGGVGLGAIRADRLRSLTIESGGLPKEPVQQLARASLPALESLELWLGTEEYGGACDAGDVRALLANTAGLPRLRRLGLRNADFADDIARALAGSALLPQLEALDLSMGTLTDDGARALIAGAASLRHLAWLDVSDNFLSGAVCAELVAALPRAVVGEQKASDGDWFYTTVGE